MAWAKYAHSVKNPKIIHMIIRRKNRWKYLCIGACAITKIKTTKDQFEVTCKNCLKILRGERDTDMDDWIRT